jgi:hypothetical protein
MTESERPRPRQPMSTLRPSDLPRPSQVSGGRIRLGPPPGRPMKCYFDVDPRPPRTYQPWVDDPRFGLKDD